jgi:hypothetical protein
MSKHIAIAVGATELRGLWMQSGTLRWHARSTLPDAHGLEESLRTLLASSPRALARSRVTLVLSPRWVHTKRLEGLPAMRSARLTMQLLRENEQAFFLWSGYPSTVVTEQTHDGCAWGAAVDTDFLGALVRAVRSERLRIVEIAPSVAAIAAAFPDQCIDWSDGAERYEIEGSRSRRRSPTLSAPSVSMRHRSSQPTPPPPSAVDFRLPGDRAPSLPVCFDEGELRTRSGASPSSEPAPQPHSPRPSAPRHRPATQRASCDGFESFNGSSRIRNRSFAA